LYITSLTFTANIKSSRKLLLHQCPQSQQASYRALCDAVEQCSDISDTEPTLPNTIRSNNGKRNSQHTCRPSPSNVPNALLRVRNIPEVNLCITMQLLVSTRVIHWSGYARIDSRVPAIFGIIPARTPTPPHRIF
jgi:hypothetical protein